MAQVLACMRQSTRSSSPPARHSSAHKLSVSVARMQAIDREAIERIGVPRLVLMDHAGRAIAQAAAALMKSKPAAWPSRSILICCGTGFNGGDGLSAGRHLESMGYAIKVALLGRWDHLRDEPATYANILRHLDVPIIEIESPASWSRLRRWLAAAPLLIDALLGIGVRGAVREPMPRLIAQMNRVQVPIVAADVPSGLDADTGLVQGAAVKAAVTVSFGLPKRGCLIAEGPAHTGRLLVDAITIPQRLLTVRG